MATTSLPAPAPDAAPAVALTPATAAALLRRDKVLSGTLPLQGWIDALAPLGDEDKRGDQTRGWLGGLAVGGGFLTFFSLFTGVLPVIAAMAAVEAGLLVAFFAKRRTDLADHLRTFVVPLLRVLRQDVAQETPVELSLRILDRFDKSHRTQKVSGIELFAYPWLAGKTRLLDGSVLDFEVTDEARRWSVTKRGSSGKTKTKTKIAVRSDVTVRLGAPRDSYELRQAPAPTAAQSIHVKTTEKRHVVTAQRTVKRKGAGSADLALRDFLGVVALAYGALGPATAGGKGGA